MMELKAVDDRSHSSPHTSLELDNKVEAKPVQDSNDSPGIALLLYVEYCNNHCTSDLSRRKVEGDAIGSTHKSQRNFLAFRGLDEESQQKAIAANLRASNEKKEEMSYPKEDLRPLVAQLEQENAKLLSKLAFNEIELKNCKNELDMMTVTIDKHRSVAEELHKVKSELLSREEELFSVRGKLRSTEYDIGLLQDQLRSKDLDIQRTKFKLEEEIDAYKTKVKSLENQIDNSKDALELKELELNKLKTVALTGISSNTTFPDQEILTLRSELSSKSNHLQKVNVQMQTLQETSQKWLQQKDDLMAELKVSQAKEVEHLKLQISELQQKVAHRNAISSSQLHVDQSVMDSLRTLNCQQQQQISDLQDNLNRTISDKNIITVELNNLVNKLKLDLENITKERDNISTEFQRSLQLSKLSESEVDEKISVANEHIKKLKGLLADKNHECSELLNQINMLTSKSLLFEERDNEIASMKSVTENLRKDNQQWKDSLDSKERDMERLQSSFHRLEAQISNDKDHYQDITRSKDISIKHLQEQVAVLSAQNQEKNERNLSLSHSKHDDFEANKKLAILEEEARMERNKAQILGLELEKLQQLLELKENALLLMSKKDEDLLSSMTRLRTIEFELASTMKALQDKESEIIILQSEGEGLKVEWSKMKNEVMRLSEVCGIKDREISKLQAELTEATIRVTLNSSTNISNGTLAGTQAEEIKSLKENLRVSRSENEQQQHEILSMRSEASKLANDLDHLQSKLRKAEMEMKHLQEIIDNNKAAERLNTEAKESENMKLRFRIREIEQKLDENHKQHDIMNDELHRLKQENSDISQQLASEREISQQKDKKIRSFREELLQLQKRMSEKETQNTFNSPSKLPIVFLTASTQTDDVVTSALNAKRSSSKGVQCSVMMADKETVLSRPRMLDISVQTEVRRNQCDVGLQTFPSHVNEDMKFKSSAAFEDIRLELDQRRAESVSLFELIKNYESKLSHLLEEQRTLGQQQPAMQQIPSIQIEREVPLASTKALHQMSSKETSSKWEPGYHIRANEDVDNRKFYGKGLADDSDISSNSEELTSLSELRTTFTNALNNNNKASFTPDKILEAMSTIFASLQSCIYHLKVHGMKCGRAMMRFHQQRMGSNAMGHFDEAIKIFLVRTDLESEFLKTQSHWLTIGKGLIKDSKVEIERLKSSWKKSSSSTKGSHDFQRTDLNLDRDHINSLTSDLNLMIRLVRMIQQSLQVRSKSVKALSNLRKKIESCASQLSVSSNLLGKMNEKCTSLDKDLDDLLQHMGEMMKPIICATTAEEDISDLDEESMIHQLSSKRPVRPKSVVELHIPHNNFDHVNMPQTRYQNFLRGSNDLENLQPMVDPFHQHIQHPKHEIPSLSPAVSNVHVNPHVQFVAHTTAAMQGYQHRLVDIQKQLSVVQTKQVDSLKECDKHVR